MGHCQVVVDRESNEQAGKETEVNNAEALTGRSGKGAMAVEILQCHGTGVGHKRSWRHMRHSIHREAQNRRDGRDRAEGGRKALK